MGCQKLIQSSAGKHRQPGLLEKTIQQRLPRHFAQSSRAKHRALHRGMSLALLPVVRIRIFPGFVRSDIVKQPSSDKDRQAEQAFPAATDMSSPAGWTSVAKMAAVPELPPIWHECIWGLASQPAAATMRTLRYRRQIRRQLLDGMGRHRWN
jgi:hypothetical protein